MFTNSCAEAGVTRAATMLLMLLLLPAIQTLGTKLLSSKTEPPTTLRKSIKSCPSEGYFFERQQQPGIEPAPCYLCYCKSDELAVCTLRDSARCDDRNRSYQTNTATTSRRHRKKHRRRLPRSPGLMELFFKDGKNEDILKEMAQHNDEDCKPKSSKSIGCPPKNWCTGCLVCDCDDDGIWRCHVMSFCEDHTPRPNSTKNLKPESRLLKILAPKNVKKGLMFKKKKTVKQSFLKPVQEKKTEKRSVNSNNNNNTDIAHPKNDTKMKYNTIKIFKKISNNTRKSFKKRSNRTSTSTTTTKPAMPLISVKTKLSFPRKDQKDKVLVIKKYISTLSPIESPDLLKYKNDSRKLAQILYQHYEASSKETKKTKREVIRGSRAESKAVITYDFLENNETQSQTQKRSKAKLKYSVKNSRRGEKILNMKPKPKYKMSNVTGIKPTNVKKNDYRNTKMKALKETGKKEKYSFYSIQKELMETGTASYIKRKQKNAKYKDYKSKYERNRNLLVTLANRKKRDVSLATDGWMGGANNLTKMGNEIVNTSSVNIDQISKTSTELSTTMENGIVNTSSVSNHVTETPVELFTNNEEIARNMNNSVYEVDDIAMKNGSGNGLIESDKEYDTTLRYENTNASEDKDMEITTNEIIKQANANLQTLSVDFNGMLTQTEQSYLQNSPSENPASPIDYALDGNSDKNDELKINTDITTTTFINYNASEKSKSETKHFNKTDNQKRMHIFSNNTNLTGSLVNNVYPKDNKDTTRTDFNVAKLEEIVNTKAFSVINSTLFVRPQNNGIVRNVSKNYKYKLKNKMAALKHLKKIYSKLLSTKNNNATQFSDRCVMKTICDTFGPCKISSKNIHVINIKINELVHETKRALNIIKTIKRFLQSIDGGNNSTGNITEENKFKSYVSKLNAILTDTYEPPSSIHDLTIIRNIKMNTQLFITSVNKFACILNDILKIIRFDKIKYDKLKKRKNTLKKVIRPKVDSELLHKIKRLFLKFNLLQNNFMHKMYQVLTDLDMQNHQSVVVDKNMYDQREKRYKMSVRKYMNKINRNLMKLKDFALKMGPRKRMKRYIRDDDDAVEYLLTLIEYLLKMNNPVNSPPVTDGVDLLLEAIRRAPDIKSIRKNNLKETSTLYSPVQELSQSSSESVDDNDENDPFSVKETEILTDNSSLEKWLNDKESKPSYFESKLDDGYKTTTPYNPRSTHAIITKYVDVEDFAFNGDEKFNVYVATDPTFDNIEDVNFIERRSNSKRAEKQKSGNKASTNKLAATSTSVAEKTQTKPQVNNVTERSSKSNFDLLNVDYENRLKSKPPTIKVKISKKHKKTKRPRVRHRTDAQSRIGKTDVSSITKETEEESTRKRVVAEEANLRRDMNGSGDESFKSMGSVGISKDISLLEGGDDELFITNFTTNFD